MDHYYVGILKIIAYIVNVVFKNLTGMAPTYQINRLFSLKIIIDLIFCAYFNKIRDRYETEAGFYATRFT